MGRRSRKRGVEQSRGEPAGASRADGAGGAGSTRAERDAARRRRAQAAASSSPAASRRSGRRGERPPAPWGSFPLTELVVLLGLVIGVGGIFVEGDRRRTMFAAAVALCCLAGLEVSIREHFAGFRSHTTLLAGSAAMAAMVGVLLAGASGSLVIGEVVLVGIAVFGSAFWALRRAFQRRSGGLSFR